MSARLGLYIFFGVGWAAAILIPAILTKTGAWRDSTTLVSDPWAGPHC